MPVNLFILCKYITFPYYTKKIKALYFYFNKQNSNKIDVIAKYYFNAKAIKPTISRVSKNIPCTRRDTYLKKGFLSIADQIKFQHN